MIGVADVFEKAVGETVVVEGYYVGVATDGPNMSKEFLLKDLESNKIISVVGTPAQSAYNYGYAVGDKIRFTATVSQVTDDGRANKLYLQWSDTNGSIADTIVSSDNEVSYNLEDCVVVNSWADMQATMNSETLPAYTYIKYSGVFYLNYSSKIYRVHMNGAATSVSDIRVDGARSIAIRDDIMDKNLGDDWTALFSDALSTDTAYPGVKAQLTFYAVYTGSTSAYYSMSVLSQDWVNSFAIEEGVAEAIKEVTLAWDRQEGQVQYDQASATSRRHVNVSPEDATAQNTIYLDCSSFVNNVYRMDMTLLDMKYIQLH